MGLFFKKNILEGINLYYLYLGGVLASTVGTQYGSSTCVLCVYESFLLLQITKLNTAVLEVLRRSTAQLSQLWSNI